MVVFSMDLLTFIVTTNDIYIPVEFFKNLFQISTTLYVLIIIEASGKSVGVISMRRNDLFIL